jgi:hypothetical protein
MRGGVGLHQASPVLLACAAPLAEDKIEMSTEIITSLFYFLLFASLQYWQLTQLVKDGEVNRAACFWIVVNTVFIAFAAVKLELALREAD